MAVLVRRTGYIGRACLLVLVPIWLVAVHGCGAQFPAGPAAVNKQPEGCRVTGRITSTAWQDSGGGIERSIVRVWELPELPELQQVAEVNSEGEEFEVRLPRGEYRLVCSAVGTRGAIFDVASREITVAEGQDDLAVGEINLPLSKTTTLYGQPAPELDRIIAWDGTPPVGLKDLRGKVVVLDFFAYYCSICHTHKSDLVKLRNKYAAQGLVVLAIHDASVKTLEEMHEKYGQAFRRVVGGEPPKLPTALDGSEEQGVFNAYGIEGIPAVILIDQRGRIVRRYHHAGKPELETDVRKLLSTPSKIMLLSAGR